MLLAALTLVLAASGAWVGAILFQSAIVAPSVFSVLDEASARRFLRTLFPRFFRLGVICGALSIAGSLAAGAASGWSQPVLVTGALAALTMSLASMALAMIPSINAARDAGEAGSRRFALLHRVSVAATLLMLASCLAIVWVAGTAMVS